MGGRLQKLDMLIATSVGVALIVQTIHVASKQVEYLPACICMLAILIGTSYADMVKPHWDGNNGLILHLLLRFESMCIFIATTRMDCSCSSNFTVLRMIWLSPFFATAHVLHGFCESRQHAHLMASEICEGS